MMGTPLAAPVHRDMSDGAIIDRFYATCMETGADPKSFYHLYGGRAGFCQSVRTFSNRAAFIKQDRHSEA